MIAGKGSETFVTVGLCVKNSEKTIRQCLQSILNQVYPKRLIEIIVVDGKSHDGTMNIIMNLVSSSGVIARFFCDEGKGLATARQIVVDNARSNYIVWVDGDTILSADFVAAQVEFIKGNHGIAVAIGKFSYQRGIQRTLVAQLQGLSRYVGVNEWARSRKRHGFPPNDASLYLVEALEQVGGFDTAIKGASEDEDIIDRMKEKGWSITLNEWAKFFAFSRETWKELWLEQIWLGYGHHFLSHKSKRKNIFLHYSPLIYLYIGVKQSFKAYKLTLEKKSFLFPLLYFFSTSAILFGFLKAHNEGYGHKKKDS
jgi:glycosyltransferase involved in cell wall biosynthesis